MHWLFQPLEKCQSHLLQRGGMWQMYRGAGSPSTGLHLLNAQFQMH